MEQRDGERDEQDNINAEGRVEFRFHIEQAQLKQTGMPGRKASPGKQKTFEMCLLNKFFYLRGIRII